MTYRIEVENLKTKTKASAEVANEWSGDASRRDYARMCDCQLAGFFFAKPSQTRDGESWMNAFSGAQFEYLRSNKCDHSMPAGKFRAVAAHLADGSVVSAQ